ncbi:hypothetical protein [Aristaeella lactis]|uniref:Uncharacterized protein n=1 Tax=Aristaeella lactis TaxID=3046383 RepID=A0AC61PLQ3_9FIRM|nr:hypothetical protein [Aristaeella lactis]QUA54664.1 hypothetical protein JYE50_15535 [Aristaeella lactis]SMC63670.1 hypothetical protein SAMN06297397_1693 [Aristaeella lactis]
MSGPKSSSYTLTAEQRKKILEEQRRQRELEQERKRVEAETQRKGGLLIEINSELEKLSLQIDRLIFLKNESEYDLPLIDETKSKIETVKTQIETIRNRETTTSSELKSQNEQLSGLLYEISSHYSLCADQVSKVTDRFHKELDSRIAEGFHLSFSNLGADKRKKDSTQIIRINETMAQLSGMTLSSKLQSHLNEIKNKADTITDPTFLSNFYSVVVVPFVKECREFEAVQKEHDELIIQYAILAEECNVSTKPVPYSKEGIEFVKNEIAKLEQQSMKQKESEYIKKALDEAMREMGYDLIGDRVVAKKSGKRIRHELYSLSNGTAVDVTYSENGQITMELGGIDQVDRQPDTDESLQLVEDMRSFCTDYDVLVKRLAEKGVKTQKLSIMPPSVEYAQIINSNDYSIKKPVSRYSVVSHRQTDTSVMHREN